MSRERIAITFQHIQYVLAAELLLFCPVVVPPVPVLLPAVWLVGGFFSGEDFGWEGILFVGGVLSVYALVFLGVAKVIVYIFRRFVPPSALRPLCVVALLSPPLLTFLPIYGIAGIDGPGIGPMSLWRLLAEL